MRRSLLAATGLTFLMAGMTGAALTGPALASEGCDVPKAEWQPEEALRQKLEADGWKINRIKIDDGCYEVYGFDGDGTRAETYFDPKTFEVVEEG